jgi:dihydroorotase
MVSKENLLYKCNWSPLEGRSLPGKILGTWVNGTRLYENGKVVNQPNGRRVEFKRSK